METVPLEIDTIAAPITAPGAAAISVIRVSGPATRDVLGSLSPESQKLLSEPRRSVLCRILDIRKRGAAEHLPLLERAIAVFFSAPNSYTGEDSAEISIHGSPLLLKQLFECFALCGVRGARPGEFTERAFLNGRLDLVQAEAVADIISAETAAQLKVAKEQLEGRLSGALLDLGEPLRTLLAEVEAQLDFPEEGIRPASFETWKSAVSQSTKQIGRYLESYQVGRIYREGVQVVIAGRPNAGKSSLLNAILGDSRAIVTDSPGTTRDSIEAHISLEGLFIRLWDTAGLCDFEEAGRELGQVERLGVERSWQRVEQAEMVLYLFDASSSIQGQSAFFEKTRQKSHQVLPLLSKVDLLSASKRRDLRASVENLTGTTPLEISVINGEGVGELCAKIAQDLAMQNVPAGSVLITTKRHYEALSKCQEALVRAKKILEDNLPLELFSAELRAGLGALDEIIGVTHTEDILGRIFSRFCVGK